MLAYSSETGLVEKGSHWQRGPSSCFCRLRLGRWLAQCGDLMCKCQHRAGLVVAVVSLAMTGLLLMSNHNFKSDHL